MAHSANFETGALLLMALHIGCMGLIEGCMHNKRPDTDEPPATINLVCPQDMELVAEKRSSVASVSWEKEDFMVTAMHAIKGIYQTVPVYGADASINRIFPEGRHYVQYKAVDEVGAFDQCSFIVTVRVIRCPAIFNPHFGIMTCTAGNMFGSECSVSCVPGYTVAGAGMLECRGDGLWSDAVPLCRMTTCPDPGTPLYGTRSCTTNAHKYGSICIFDCASGYQLLGNNRLICGSSGEWLASPPSCRKIIPPRVEKCPPSSIHMTTTGLFAEVEKPSVVFMTDAGNEVQHSCSHFTNGSSQNFTLGTYLVSCSAYDPNFGTRAVSKCEFYIRVKANPCRTLPQPLDGSLLCSRAHGGGSATYDTICQLFCNQGFALGRSDGIRTGEYRCDHRGSWLPSDIIPSCVLPKRPLEIKLPSEIYYASHSCPIDPAHIYEIRAKFQSMLQSSIRQAYPCSSRSQDCIVEDTSVKCQLNNPEARLKRLRRYLLDSRRHQDEGHIAKIAGIGERRLGRKAHSFRLTIQFHFGTRIPEVGGLWPDEFHEATNRLFGMFEHLEKQLEEGIFDVHKRLDSIDMEPVADSLTFASFRAICDIGYSFNETILLCVSCGPGSYYNISVNRCVICVPGTYQDEQAAFECKRCPEGSATLEKGANSLTQCVDVDECLSGPCFNNGQCHNGHNHYTCTCLPGYSGVQCEEQVYDCEVHSCLNRGTCLPSGPDNYTCRCRPSYSGDYCQFATVDGGWGDWTEWSSCSKSCDGGVKTRSRLCDSPLPGHGGRHCPDASVEEMVCNLLPCPECKKLRRPYQGSIRCEVNSTEDAMYCTIKCQDGYMFHGAVLPVYICGRSTSHLWPHESPDNPRALLPACTETVKPEKVTYQFLSSLPLECTSEETRAALQQIVENQARQVTSGLDCIRQGTCSLDVPDISGCDVEGVATRRRKRMVPHEGVNVSVALIYHVADTASHKHKIAVDLNRMKKEMMDFGAHLLQESEEGSLFVEFNGSKLLLDSRHTTTSNSVACIPGSTPSNDGLHCVTCSPGSYFLNTHQLCVLCEIAFFQPKPGQLNCIPCPDKMITYGRGAVNLVECYTHTMHPPDIPEEHLITDPGSRDLNIAFGVFGGFIVFTLLLFVTVFVITWRRITRRKEYNLRTVGTRTRWTGQTHEQVHLCAVGSITEEKA